MLVLLQVLSFATVLGLIKLDSGFTDGLVPCCEMRNIATGSKRSDQHAADSEGCTASPPGNLVIWRDEMKHWGACWFVAGPKIVMLQAREKNPAVTR